MRANRRNLVHWSGQNDIENNYPDPIIGCSGQFCQTRRRQRKVDMHFRLIASAGQARNPHSCVLWRRFVVQPVRSSSIASDRSTMASSALSGLKHESCPTSLVQSEIHLLMEAEMLPSGTIWL